MVRSFVSALTMKMTTIQNVAMSRGSGSVSDYDSIMELASYDVVVCRPSGQ
ncbi:unnamed protein product [Prunus armeniaca]|uniref:Uncharacterized protein n=1 Tax=Prunus armeniaca TaxID=36596 RepID=A0A6J5V8E2_PRUAR|nr:unnamed protein product [Prunus armeniaca]